MWHIIIQISGYMNKVERIVHTEQPTTDIIEYWEGYYKDMYEGNAATCINVFYTNQ